MPRRTSISESEYLSEPEVALSVGSSTISVSTTAGKKSAMAKRPRSDENETDELPATKKKVTAVKKTVKEAARKKTTTAAKKPAAKKAAPSKGRKDAIEVSDSDDSDDSVLVGTASRKPGKSAPTRKPVAKKSAPAKKQRADDETDDDDESDGEPKVAKTKFEMAGLKPIKAAAKMMAKTTAAVHTK